jgi:hypothetical protein
MVYEECSNMLLSDVFFDLKMEESSYVPNSIPPALVVFSGAGYGDAIRMQRPFGTQVCIK